MKDRKKLTLPCLLLVLALLCPVLAACQTDAVPIPTAPPATQPSTAPTSVPTQPPETTAPTEYIGLTMFTPQEAVITVDDTFVLSGLSDPKADLFINDDGVERGDDGSFSCPVSLKVGDNTITVVHKDETVTYQIHRRYCVQYYTPEEGRSYGSGATVFLRIAVRAGSTVTAHLHGEEVHMYRTVDQQGNGLADGFELYLGEYYLPDHISQPLNLGAVTFTVSCDGITETYTSGELTCNAEVEVKYQDPDATPEGYRNVGSGYIVEVVDHSVETFSGLGTNDLSRPTYNYLPQGTLDYGSPSLIESDTGDQTYRLLRCGVRVYATVKNTPYSNKRAAVDCYTGYLPDHNEIGVASLTIDGHHTVLALDCLWKAPFFFDYEPQQYEDETNRRYKVEKFDADYIDITFCYATQIGGQLEIPEDHPLFSGYEWIQNAADYTLRLYLKQPGGLYGWDAYYNEADLLCFRFLNPVLVTEADNAYGADLTGVRILIDVGHGGADNGAAGFSNGLGYYEKNRNLELSLLLQQELESIGATVIITRTEDVTNTQRERIQFLKEQAPDYCISIHHNYADRPTQHGFEAGFFSPVSQRATELIYEATRDANLYRHSEFFWHYYYVARQSVCINVLTESGYMSHTQDMDDMVNPEIVQKKAEALCQGIVNYYLELAKLYP